MTGTGMRGRRQTATREEKGFRALLKEYGFRAEAVPFIRQRDDAHTAIVCSAKEVGNVVELFTRKLVTGRIPMDITRIHIPKENRYGQPWCRVYFRWEFDEPCDDCGNALCDRQCARA